MWKHPWRYMRDFATSSALRGSFPPKHHLHRILYALGSTYQAMQQWEEAQAALEEAEAIAETVDLGPFHLPALTRLCMNCTLAGQWKQAYKYTLKAIAVRKRANAALITLDFYRQYETEALLRGGNESQARAEVQRLG